MNANYELKTEEDKEEQKEFDKIQNLPEIPSKKNQYPKIAGILLILAGILSLIFWLQFYSIDVSYIVESGILSQVQKIDSDITAEELVSVLKTCITILIIMSIFPILGGILSIKRKLFGIVIVCAIIGIFLLGLLFLSFIFSFIALILLIVSRKEF
jgi:hypothetical protein